MVSSTVQVSLLVSEVNVLKDEANRQMAIAISERLDAIANGEEEPKVKAIGPPAVGAQIIRRALPGLKIGIEKDKKGRLKK